MLKFLPILLLSFLIVNVANAQIYLRKDTQENAQEKVQSSQNPAPTPEPKAAHKEVVPSQNALANAKNVANACLGGQWETQPCLKAVSENNLLMASSYAAALSEKGRKPAAEVIKETCAASTAAIRGEYPPEAMRSAYVECVNAVVEISQGTGVIPDQSQFQLLFSAVNCLDGAPSCAAIEQGLAAYK